jgi:hypothetical protein
MGGEFTAAASSREERMTAYTYVAHVAGSVELVAEVASGKTKVFLQWKSATTHHRRRSRAGR